MNKEKRHDPIQILQSTGNYNIYNYYINSCTIKLNPLPTTITQTLSLLLSLTQITSLFIISLVKMARKFFVGGNWKCVYLFSLSKYFCA